MQVKVQISIFFEFIDGSFAYMYFLKFDCSSVVEGKVGSLYTLSKYLEMKNKRENYYSVYKLFILVVTFLGIWN